MGKVAAWYTQLPSTTWMPDAWKNPGFTRQNMCQPKQQGMRKHVEKVYGGLEVVEVGGFEVCIVTVPCKYDVEKNVQSQNWESENI